MVKLDGAAEFPEAVARHRPRRHPGVRADRHHAADGAAIRHRLRDDAAAARRAGPGRDDRAAWSRRRSALEKPARRCSTSPIPARSPGAAVVKAVKIPVIGGFGGGPWLDGRVRMAHAAIGYAAKRDRVEDRDLRQRRPRHARRVHGAMPRTCAPARQIKGGIPVKPPKLMTALETGDRAHRRHRDALRGHRARAAAADVRARAASTRRSRSGRRSASTPG